MDNNHLYMITLTKQDITSEVFKKIDLIEEMSFFSNNIINLAMSEDTSKIWIVLKAASESELVHVLHKFSFTQHFEYEYAVLAINQSTTHYQSRFQAKI